MKSEPTRRWALRPAVEVLVGMILLAYPVLLFFVQGGMNGSLFLLALAALLILAICPKGNSSHRKGLEWAFAVAMGSGLAAILASQLYHHDMQARYFDSAARFLLAVPIFLALRKLEIETLQVVQYAFPLGAIAALLAIMAIDPNVKYNAATFFMNHIHLGDMALLLGFLSIFSINWFEQDRMVIKALKVAGLVAGLVVSILSSARGGWVAIPVFVALYYFLRTRGGFLRKLTLVTTLLGVAGLAAYFLVEPFHYRVSLVYSDLATFSSGNLDSSIGVRLQLWKAAVHLIAENPVFGVGANGFGEAMNTLRGSGLITSVAAELGKAEVHNEVLAQAVRFGVFGFVSIMAIYFVPFTLFLRAARTGTGHQQLAGLMGMCTTAGFFVFGLTVETFDLKMTAAFYALTVAVLLALASKGASQETNPTSISRQ